MIVAVSPYHLTSREAPAYAALLLARQVVTLLPAPRGGMEGAAALASRVRAYADFTRSWAWTSPLWRAGVLTGEIEGRPALEELEEVSTLIRRDDRYAAIRAFFRAGDFADEAGYLAGIAADVLRAGPDPGLSLPVVAALDRFALRHGAAVARPVAVSLAQQAEMKSARPLASFAVPVLVQADAERLLRARAVLSPALEGLWAACESIPATTAEHGTIDPRSRDAVVHAAADLSRQFEAEHARLFENCKGDDVRAIEAAATVSLVAMPGDAVLRSGVAAIEGVTRGRAASARTTLPVLADPLSGRWLTAMIVKPLGARPR